MLSLFCYCLIVNRCGHIESGRPTELDKAKLLQTLQPVHASLPAEDGQRFREKMRPQSHPPTRDTRCGSATISKTKQNKKIN